jgi:hypothetical protein
LDKIRYHFLTQELPKVNNHPIGENLPNLVTLLAVKGAVKYCSEALKWPQSNKKARADIFSPGIGSQIFKKFLSGICRKKMSTRISIGR